MLPDTYHVHETVFSTLAGDIMRLSLPVVKTTALLQVDTYYTHLLSHCPCFSESSMTIYDCACVSQNRAHACISCK